MVNLVYEHDLIIPLTGNSLLATLPLGSFTFNPN
jgi:hypothetical protein